MSKSPSPKTRIKTEILSDTIKALINESRQDLHHAQQVTKLALALFDKLVGIHDMGPRERLLLEISAMLHDIGWSRTTNGGHHKHSRDMILEAELPEITKREKNICALVARYHNKAEPDASRHKSYAALKRGDRLIISWLAAILRVADGLDCLHNGKVSIRKCKIDKKRLTILLSAKNDCAAEIRGARRKSGLLDRMSRRDLVFQRCS
jgi:exopolyphosphatase / guanosine-5'-triphosphate,3'-diphosphate pyrophosphatase